MEEQGNWIAEIMQLPRKDKEGILLAVEDSNGFVQKAMRVDIDDLKKKHIGVA